MWKRFWHFLQYNNAVPLVAILFLGSVTATFAASDTAREAVYAAKETVISVDNRYLLSQVIDDYSFNMKIEQVREDADNYYVDYSYKTMEVQDYVWQDVIKKGTFTYSHRELLGKDLGEFVAKQLGDIVDSQRKLLAEAQKIELRDYGFSPKVASVEYSGLIGRFLNSDTKEFPGYTPVVVKADTVPAEETLAAYLRNGQPYSREETEKNLAGQVDTALEQGKQETAAAAAFGPDFPVIHMNGRNPANLDIGQSYADLGVTATDDKDDPVDLRITTKGDQIDTTKAGEYFVEYSVTDSDGHTSTAKRSVIVSDPFASQRTSSSETPPAETPAPEKPADASQSSAPAPVEEKTTVDPAPPVTPSQTDATTSPPSGDDTATTTP